ncbi:MAG: transglycosylase domain-containing protein [Clostridia bacterium]|nr:transglycosylase domain-containing protein [Clostridia bacterium]
MKKVLKVSFEVMFLLTALAVLIVLCVGIYSLTVLKVDLDISAITDNNLTIDVFNSENLLLKENNSFNGVNIKLEYLPEHTKNAFISIEDKDFYKHSGINAKRMVKAFVNNLKNMKIVEGASTITQQLIKNTHLSNEKTFTRKINEISLAVQLEKKMSKNQILENYLNTIYFGNNCYGIENASQYYFSQSAKDLDISQSALLAGIIKSPNYNSPTKQPERSLKRRNLVLSEMLEDKKITKEQYNAEKVKKLDLVLNKTIKNKLNSYSQSAIDEAMDILKMPEKQIAIGEYKIFTYQDMERQTAFENTIKNFEIGNDFALIDIEAKTGNVLAFLGKSDYKILDFKRQPGSIIKPILVYAPAINENIISPATQILDEPLSIDGYTPHNINDNYSGYVSAREALSKSLNIPAVKTATYVGLEKINYYANQLEIDLDSKDKNYALALGGMTYGTNLQTLAGAYTALANGGVYCQPKFVYYITTKDGVVVYKNPQITKQVFRDDTAYLATDILKTCAKTGTAKKLADLPFEVASKTGTVGTKTTNLDAYNVSYTTKDIVGVWFGNMDNKSIDTVGGNMPTMIAKNFLKNIYKTKKPAKFAKPHSVEEIEIDLTEIEENHNVVRANTLTPTRYKTKEVFSRFNLPKENSNAFLINPTILTGKVKNNKAILTFNANNYLDYELYKIINDKTILVKTFSTEKGTIEVFDDIVQNKKVSYYIISKLEGESETSSAKSNIVNLLNTKNNVDTKAKDKWYI